MSLRTGIAGAADRFSRRSGRTGYAPLVAVHGIDLGTTNSAIARVGKDGRPEVLAGLSGDATTPSVVLFAGDGGVRRAEVDSVDGHQRSVATAA